MDSRGASGSGGRSRPPPLTAQALSLLGEGISLVLSRWTALQIAVENGWGGRDSRLKSDELASSILSWFAQPNADLYVDDLEDMLDEHMRNSMNTIIEDGSVEEVATEMMIMHEECLEGKSETIEKLRNQAPGRSAVSQSKQAVDDDDDESSDDASEMMVDEPNPKEMVVDEPKPKQMPDEDGWTFVAPKRNRGKRSG